MSDIINLLLNINIVLNIIFGIVIVFFERRNPAVTWAWLMVLTLVPFVGFVLYLTFGLDSRKSRLFATKAKHDGQIFSACVQLENVQQLYDDTRNRTEAGGIYTDMIRLNFYSSKGIYTLGNRLRLYFDGTDKFDALLADIASARKYIHMQYYIIRYDNTSRRVIEALAQKAAEGVKVRLLYDGMGCVFTSKRLFSNLIAAGGEVTAFLPPSPIRINYRNHRKLCIIDGQIGYIGGYNIGDEYLGLVKRFGYWRDTHLRIVGTAVYDLQIRFIMDWNFYSRIKISMTLSDLLPLFPRIHEQEDDEELSNADVQIVSSGPDTQHHSILYSYTKMISEAQRSVYIQTPYFVPDDSILEALRIAALSGKDVRIMIPAHPDHPFVYWAALSYLGELLSIGVKCYQYQNGFIHTKVLIIDSKVASVGTANMDVRSFKLNFECNAFIYDRETATRLEKQFLIDQDFCSEITGELYENRSTLTKIKESVSRLLSPLL